MSKPTPPDDSLGDFIREAFDDHAAGVSQEPELPTMKMDGEQKREATLGALPGHEVEGFIARGGMGSVYRARQAALEREVAVKVMTSEVESPEMAERFRREALVLGKLAHPNIVPVYDIGTDEHGHVFYTMKLVQGRTLQAILHDLRAGDADALRTHPLASLLTIFRKVCDALAFAHSHGILHRDLKPENVMVGEFGEVLVMDWGLAKMLGDKEEAPRRLSPSSVALQRSDFGGTMEGSVMGTPQYMSPEQAQGRIDELDERSDLFSLGGILYAILTLRPPVEGATLEEVLKKVCAAQITSPSDWQAGAAAKKGDVLEAKLIRPLPHVDGGRVPAALSAVAMKALRLDKARRYQSVAEMSADIEAFQGGFATKAEEAGLAKQLLLLIRRNKGIFTTAAAAWLVITALAGWFVMNLRAKERRAVQAEAFAVQREGETSKALGRSALSLAEAALREGNGPAMQAALKDVPENLRDSTWRHLLGQSDTSIARIDVGAPIDGVVAHPRLPSVFAVVDHRGKVTILNVRTGARLLEFAAGFSTKGTPLFYSMAISPDGERIGIGRWGYFGDLVIHDVRGGKKILERKTAANPFLCFSPDGRWLLRGGRENPVELLDATTGQPRWSRVISHNVLSAAFTPDGGQVLMQLGFNDTELRSGEDGSLVRAVAKHRATASALRPDGQFIVTGDQNGMIRGVELSDGRAVFEFRTDNRQIDQLAFTSNGKLFASIAVMADGRQAVRLWDARTGAPVQSLLGGSGQVRGVSVHPLSSELVVCGPETRAWGLAGARWSLSGKDAAHCAFWGEDDVMIAPAREADAALVRLQERSATTLWTLSRTDFREKDVSADGRFAVFGGKLTKLPFVLLRRTGQKVEEVIRFTPEQMLQRLRLSPSGASLAAIEGLNEWVELFDSSTGKQRVKLPRTDIKRFWEVGWLNEKELVGLVTAKAERGAAGSEEWVVRWDATTGKVLQTAMNPSTMDVLVIAPDGRWIAEAGADKRVRIRDAATLAVLKEFRAHDGPITALAWHSKKPILATGSTDLAIRLWNLETGERIDELRGPIAAPHTLAFAPSGQRLGCASLDATTYIWDPPSLRDETAAPMIVGSEATDERVWFKKPLPDRPAAPTPEKPKPALPKGAEGWEDLLAALTPEEVEKSGHGWSLKDGELFSPDKTGHANLPLPGEVSATSYRVRVRLRQLAAKQVFHIILPVADRMCGFDFEGRSPGGGVYTGLGLVNGKYGKNLPGVVVGKLVNDTDQHDLEVTVRLDGANATITTTLDGKPLYEWTGPTAALSQAKAWATTAPGTLALGAYSGGWMVSEVKLKRL